MRRYVNGSWVRFKRRRGGGARTSLGTRVRNTSSVVVGRGVEESAASLSMAVV
ncbi:hypothetical protein FKM82_019831 [Ascaphus truei]